MAVQSTTVQQHVAEHARSRVGAWAQLGNLVLLPGSLAMTGPAAVLIGGQAVLVAGAAWLAFSTALAMCVSSVRTLGGERSSPAAEAGEPSSV